MDQFIPNEATDLNRKLELEINTLRISKMKTRRTKDLTLSGEKDMLKVIGSDMTKKTLLNGHYFDNIKKFEQVTYK